MTFSFISKRACPESLWKEMRLRETSLSQFLRFSIVMRYLSCLVSFLSLTLTPIALSNAVIAVDKALNSASVFCY